jgi:two-component system sensor histidine kinase RegB
MAELVAVPALLALMNVGTWAYGRQRAGYSYLELLGALMLDVEALSWQLYFTGGATNPFIFLFLVQIMLGAIFACTVELDCRAGGLLRCRVSDLDYRPLELPPAYAGEHFRLYLLGSLACFVLIAAILVYFVVRMDRNQRASSAALAALRQQAAEENHIVRLGLLASGAAHELGTPMASMSVILGDWAREKTIAGDPDLSADVADMQAELKRCKAILSGILMAAGEVRGENPSVTTARGFLCEIVEDWRARSPFPSN